MSRRAAIAIAPMPPDFGAWDELIALILRAFAPMAGVIDPPSSAQKLSPAGLSYKAKAETVLLAQHAGRLAGCLFVEEKADRLYLNKLAVEPAVQGLGVGRRLVQAAEALARQSGKPALELQTRVELTGNHEAFRRLGFSETGRSAHPGFSRPTSITFRKRVA